jgi:signal peptidase I
MILNRVKSISENLLNTGYDVRMNTFGLSMFPLIRTGDKITINAESNLHKGDIIVFERGEQMVCHRLVRVFEKDGIRYYQTRGDTSFGLDEPVTADQILGKIVRIERENVSLLRRILLFIYPLLGVGRLNAVVTTILIRVRKLLAFKKS